MEKINTILWDELLETPASDARSELSGFLSVLPASVRGDHTLVDTRRLVAARRMLKLCKGLKEESFDGRIAGSESILELDKNRSRAFFRIPSLIYAEYVSREARASGRWSWFRGAWGGCGAIYLPQQGYYMSFRVLEGAACGPKLTETLHSAGAPPRVRKNGRHTEYTVRDLEGIISCLSRMGLVRTSLFLEETAVIRSVRGIANKRVNCDSANIDKSLTAARAQMLLVDALDRYDLWRSLSPEIAELARVRRENPSASLGELGQILSKPVSKSTVEYRWRKLESLIGGEKYTRL